MVPRMQVLHSGDEARIGRASSGWVSFLGVPLEEINGVLLSEFLETYVHPNDMPDTSNAAELIKRSGSTLVNFENRYASASFGWVKVLWTVFTGGNITHCVAKVEVPDEQ